MPGKLCTHALDIHHGRPAANVLIKFVSTHAGGRTDGPLVGLGEMEVGRDELVFAVGAQFAKAGVPLALPPFLDETPVRCAIANVSLSYHNPLLFSPWADSTYRGS